MTEQDDAQPLRSIILATDFSSSVRVAEHYAAFLAQHYNANLIVAHAFMLEQPAMEAEELAHVPSRQRQDIERQLAETVKELARITPHPTSVLGQGNPAEVIDRLLQQYRPAMAVLGTHGGGATGRRFIGSVAEGILRTVQDPVLTVGPHVAAPSADRLAFRHILYATDFSAAAARAGSYALALARSFGSDLDVLHVVSEDGVGKQDLIIKKEREFLTVLGELSPGDSSTFPKSRTFVETGKARERILEHARKGGVDLIVLGAHYHSHFARHLRTGPAFQIILEATCPVLTLCAPQ
jgi:nucleotide-binding universal stress UspA family protein